MKRVELGGQKFGRWLVIDWAGNRRWNCICDCGTKSLVRSSSLRRAETHSCFSCRPFDHAKTHGGSSTRLHRIWKGMKERCLNPANKGYAGYGAQGVTICSEWATSFDVFSSWAMEHGYSDDLSIDRHPDCAGNYEPTNCRWATQTQQANNKRNNRLFTFCGETKTIAEFSVQFGIPDPTLRSRLLQLNWPIERALSTVQGVQS